MPATDGVLWPSFYKGDASRIRKWLFGSVLVRDWDALGSTSMEDLPVFLDDGELNPDLLLPVSEGGYGFFDVGNISDNGVEFNPQFNTDETPIWQSRRSQRTDITRDDEEVSFSMMDSTPLTDYLWWNLPIGFDGVGDFPAIGTSGYEVTKPYYSDLQMRQLLIIGVDGSVGPNGQAEYIAELRPRVSLQKKSRKQWHAKNVDVTELTWTVHVDPFSGFDSKVLRGGPVWLGEGGVLVLPTPSTVTGTAVAGGKATLVFKPPAGATPPYTYTVKQKTGSTTTDATLVGNPVFDGNSITLTVSGLTTSSSYTFTVIATAANESTVTYPVSGSVSAIA